MAPSTLRDGPFWLTPHSNARKPRMQFVECATTPHLVQPAPCRHLGNVSTVADGQTHAWGGIGRSGSRHGTNGSNPRGMAWGGGQVSSSVADQGKHCQDHFPPPTPTPTPKPASAPPAIPTQDAFATWPRPTATAYTGVAHYCTSRPATPTPPPVREPATCAPPATTASQHQALPPQPPSMPTRPAPMHTVCPGTQPTCHLRPARHNRVPQRQAVWRQQLVERGHVGAARGGGPPGAGVVVEEAHLGGRCGLAWVWVSEGVGDRTEVGSTRSGCCRQRSASGVRVG